MILEATSRTAYRSQNWVLIPPYSGPAVSPNVNIEIGNASEYQLYNLEDDIAQQQNLAGSNPQKLREMIDRYKSIININ